MHMPAKPTTNSKTNSGILRWSMAVASFLAFLKLTVGLLSNSMSLLASAVDSLMDVLVSLVNFLSLKEAEKPADHDHAYGHGKIESLASLFQSIIISAGGIYLIIESVHRLVLGEPIVMIRAGIVVMVISIVITYLHTVQLDRAAKKSQSLILKTEKLHFTTDVWTNLGVIGALLLAHVTGQIFWDVLVAVIVAGYILSQSLHILKHSVDELIDRALPDEEQDRIKQIVMNFSPKIVGIHNFRTRKISQKKFIEFHVEMDRHLSFEKAHDLTEDLIEEIERQIPDSDVMAHYDPEGTLR
ncbi:MAG: hypothetical protein COV74_02250 [Candidatus Omnitrophica bacterium CG11_big_fil_rev_8_21_14_0_20_45_26]|uniref:Uncharacterized protein n=1 Tax=Candidatus Abzuiibacterium crystallinum TaxID=1974748 RepID=A0A2H0LRS8_9BACT|nr:MAG: hypothetical protein COV74_02250 [Candidatus Omnitrophica bacterium CG11_big_fil_rev_8_21_14_0_20_45_26]PIW65532.1 MAG: hypothetical protein COW12_01400 [Candidatus Omnitrophica bacterium CG12_big_fil_rev_8_21_14_0_65_45_16]